MYNYFKTIKSSDINKKDANKLVGMLNDLLGREAYVMSHDSILGEGVKSTERGVIHFEEAALLMKNGLTMENAAKESLKTAPHQYFTSLEWAGISETDAKQLVGMLNDLFGRMAYVMSGDFGFGVCVKSTERGVVHFEEAALLMKNGLAMEDAAKESLKTAPHQYFMSIERVWISETDAKQLVGMLNDLLGRMAYVMDTDIGRGVGVLSTERGVVHFKEAAKLMKSGMPMENAAKESMKVEPVPMPCYTVHTTTVPNAF